jgi:hypothetical protein
MSHTPLPDRLLKWELRLVRKVGHIRMTINFGRHVDDTERDQSAGTEMPDALAKAKKLWGFSSAELVSATDKEQVYSITPTH